MTDWTRRLGLNALATLPLWCALGAVAVIARDLSEIAAAAIAAASLVTVLGVGAIAVVMRRAGRAAAEHDTVVRQSLALIDCMKEINRRLMDVEAQSPPEPPLAVVETLTTPDAANDRRADGEVAPASETAAAPTTEAVRRLRDGALAGLSCEGGAFTCEDALAGAIDSLAVARGAVEIRIGPAGGRSDTIVRLAALLARSPERAGRVLVGIDESDLRGGGAALALMLARLTQAGARLSLHVAMATPVAPRGLAGAGIARLSVDAGDLLRAMADDPDRVTGWIEALALEGIELVATGVDATRKAAMLAAIGVPLGVGPALSRLAASPPVERPALPWLGRRKAGTS